MNNVINEFSLKKINMQFFNIIINMHIIMFCIQYFEVKLVPFLFHYISKKNQPSTYNPYTINKFQKIGA
jgi:hypothetical protein